MIAEIFLYGFVSAFGWWTANHYVIEPHFPPPIEQKKDEKKETKNKDTDIKQSVVKDEHHD